MKAIQFVDEAVKILSHDDSLTNRYNSGIDSFEQSKNHWQQDKIRVGVIGVTSSGKSTMINSILGDTLLSMAVKPSSSQLVSCSKSDSKKATVFFQSGKKEILEGEKLTEDNIKKYSDENYNKKNKEAVAQLELSTQSFELGEDVLLIDSPGLDAYGLQNHEELTLEVLLPSIDVCIFVTTLKTNSDEKMHSVLDVISKYKCPIIIVQNMLDSIKPSVDGEENACEVATKHKRRVEKIVNNSKIENKSNVRIVQISAAQALQARCNLDLSDSERTNLMKKSNYNEFVSEVLDMINRERPNIENQRIRSIGERIKKIIDDGKEDLKEETSPKNLRFEYEGFSHQIINKAEKTEKSLYELLSSLETKNNKLPKISNSSENSKAQFIFEMFKTESKVYSDSDIEHIKKIVKTCEKEILNQISNFNTYLGEVAKKLNIPSRDIVSVNGLPSMPELTLKKKTIVKKKRVKKSTFGSGIARLFGGIFDNDWGYEDINEPITVIDNVETQKELESYLSRAKNTYIKEIDSWTKKTKSPIDQLLAQIENRSNSFEERKQAVVEAEKLRKTITDLKNLIAQVKDISYSKKDDRVKSTAANVHINLEEVEFNKNTYNIARLADVVLNSIYINTIKLVLDECNAISRDSIIYGWDLSCMASFAKRFAGIILTQKQLEILEKQKCLRFDKYIFCFNPKADDNINFIAENVPKNTYVLTNTTQIGSAQTQINKSGICNKILKDDFLAFVIQDFTELINGNGISEGVRNMMLISSELDIQHSSLIFINHENPIYNLAIIEAQRNPSRIIKEETEMLGKIRKCFSYLRNEIVDEQLADIVRASNQRGRNYV